MPSSMSSSPDPIPSSMLSSPGPIVHCPMSSLYFKYFNSKPLIKKIPTTASHYPNENIHVWFSAHYLGVLRVHEAIFLQPLNLQLQLRPGPIPIPHHLLHHLLESSCLEGKHFYRVSENVVSWGGYRRTDRLSDQSSIGLLC